MLYKSLWTFARSDVDEFEECARGYMRHASYQTEILTRPPVWHSSFTHYVRFHGTLANLFLPLTRLMRPILFNLAYVASRAVWFKDGWSPEIIYNVCSDGNQQHIFWTNTVLHLKNCILYYTRPETIPRHKIYKHSVSCV